jgi:hypothetical protein
MSRKAPWGTQSRTACSARTALVRPSDTALVARLYIGAFRYKVHSTRGVLQIKYVNFLLSWQGVSGKRASHGGREGAENAKLKFEIFSTSFRGVEQPAVSPVVQGVCTAGNVYKIIRFAWISIQFQKFQFLMKSFVLYRIETLYTKFV